MKEKGDRYAVEKKVCECACVSVSVSLSLLPVLCSGEQRAVLLLRRAHGRQASRPRAGSVPNRTGPRVPMVVVPVVWAMCVVGMSVDEVLF